MSPSPWDFGWDQIIGLINAATVLIAAIVGVWGMRNWKEERINIRQFELAEEALSLMYRAQEIFDIIRNPAGFSNEGQTRVPGENETEDQKRQRDHDFIPLERMNNEKKFFEKIMAIRPGIKAIFGEKKSEPLDKILELRGNIISAARMLSHMRPPRHFGNEEQERKHYDRNGKYESIIWKDHAKAIDDNNEDPIDVPLKEAIEKLKFTVGPIINKRLKIR